jgi:Glycosyltransferase family 9 (heptosyltransferase)
MRYFKYFIKIRIIGTLRSILFFVFRAAVQKKNWENRVLLINFEAIGDIAVATGILKYAKEDFGGKEVYLLIQKSADISALLPHSFKLKTITASASSFIKNPWHGVALSNRLRSIGFATVVAYDPSIAEFAGKTLATMLGAKNILGYEGMGIQLTKPLDENMRGTISYIKHSLFRRFSRIVESFDKGRDLSARLPHVLEHYAFFHKEITGVSRETKELDTILSVPFDVNIKVLELLKTYDVKPGTYCLLTMGTTTPHREWGVERFARVALQIHKKGIPIVIAGAPREREFIPRFRKIFPHPFVDLAGKTRIEEYAGFIANSFFSLSCDTAAVHLAIALKKPSVAVLGLGHFGMISLYGYSDINKWVYKKDMPCLCDNWQCIYSVGPSDPAPCISAVSEDAVSSTVLSLVSYLRANPGYQHIPFTLDILG